MLKSRDFLAKNETDVLKDEKKGREDLEAADELGEKWKSLDTKTHKLLQKAIPSALPPA